MITKDIRKSFKIRESGRSSDYISPSFGFGCLLNCSYCYMKRHKPFGLSVATNIDQILSEINKHAKTAKKIADQTDPKYITYDISCNEDFALHAKYYDWEKIFDFFRDHPIAKGTFATKIVPTTFLNYDPEEKIRIRFSLMPQEYSYITEPNSTLILDRIKAIDTFINAGYDVHINYSPVIMKSGFMRLYRELFNLVDTHVTHKDKVKAEVIFLTHNEKKHEYNLQNNIPGEDMLWTPQYQENKISKYGGKNVRYKYNLKKLGIEQFKKLHDDIIPWNTIRYIF